MATRPSTRPRPLPPSGYEPELHAEASGAITDKARELNEGRTVYEGGAALAAAQDERRMMLTRLHPERILDEEHMADLVATVATWAPDILRQAELRRVGSSQLQGRILQPHEYAELLEYVREPKTK